MPVQIAMETRDGFTDFPKERIWERTRGQNVVPKIRDGCRDISERTGERSIRVS